MKRVLSILFVIFLISAFALPVFAEDHDYVLPTVIDNADVFTDEQEAELSSRIEKIVDKYDVDYVILTVDDNEGYSPEDYTLKFLREAGYGSEGRSAVIFYICFDPSDRAWWTTPKNAIKKYFTERAINDIDDAIEPDMKSGDYYEAALTHISYIEKMASGKYHEPINWMPIIIGIIAGVVVGLIVGGMRLASCRKAMRIVAPVDAHEYLVRDSFNLRNKQVYYLYTTVTNTAKPKSSSSSGGGSSYSSSSSSGGRRF